MKKLSIYLIILTLVITVCLSGCASNKQIYYWGNYETLIYAYLKGESPGSQLLSLERDRGRIEADGKKAPPGFYAHIGLLHMELGNIAEAILCFETEKYLFPEAATYMDFLLTNLGR
ncbi:MAG: DUF4810 domain-containing protein [Treponema sp.]|jgi:hypothetical protein|nr:DUF4810 domain-containing protein [Treponema sp.]